MKILLTMVLCSSVNQSCLQPITYPEAYADSFSCMVEGYERAYNTTIELGADEVNKNGLYIKFGCGQVIVPVPKPKTGV